MIFACAAQWALADKLRGLPLRLKTTTLLISHWLNNNSISCLHNSTSCDLWPLIGQNVVHYLSHFQFQPWNTISCQLERYLIPAKNVIQITVSWRISKLLISDWPIIPYPVSFYFLYHVVEKTISCLFNLLDLEIQHFSHDMSFDMSTYDSFHSYWRK